LAPVDELDVVVGDVEDVVLVEVGEVVVLVGVYLPSTTVTVEPFLTLWPLPGDWERTILS
jgi:flagellar biogenesis protein FliO